MYPVQIHRWQLLAPRDAETMCYISCDISKIASSTLWQPNTVGMCSAKNINNGLRENVDSSCITAITTVLIVN